MNPPASSTRPRLLVIDDDRKLCRLIAAYLDPLGYDVTAVHTGPEGVERATAEAWQAVILDLMLPGLDGFEVLKQIRHKSDVPVLMLTSRGDEADRIVVSRSARTTICPRPSRRANCSPACARSRGAPCVLRRPTEDEGEIVVANLRLNAGARTAALGDQPLVLTPSSSNSSSRSPAPRAA